MGRWLHEGSFAAGACKEIEYEVCLSYDMRGGIRFVVLSGLILEVGLLYCRSEHFGFLPATSLWSNIGFDVSCEIRYGLLSLKDTVFQCV